MNASTTEMHDPAGAFGPLGMGATPRRCGKSSGARAPMLLPHRGRCCCRASQKKCHPDRDRPLGGRRFRWQLGGRSPITTGRSPESCARPVRGRPTERSAAILWRLTMTDFPHANENKRTKEPAHGAGLGHAPNAGSHATRDSEVWHYPRQLAPEGASELQASRKD